MKKCIILLPTFYNDGRDVPIAVMDDMLHQIYDNFGAYTLGEPKRGVYRMKGGRKACDVSLEIWVGVDPLRIDDLRRLASKFAATLGQEAIYFEIGGDIELIGPDPADQ